MLQTTPPSRPLNVVIATPRLQLFEALDDLGVRTFQMADDAPPADILVFPAGTTKVFGESIAASKCLPKAVAKRVRSGKTRIVIDGSSEGFEHTPQRSTLLEEIVRASGAPLSKAAYVGQEVNYASDYAAWRRASGADGESLTILHHDAWVWRFLAQFAANGAEVLEERLAAFRARPAVRPRRLVSLNFTRRPHKVLFLLRLMRDGFWEKAFVSFGGVARFREIFRADSDEQLLAVLSDDARFASLADELFPQIPALEDYGRVLLDAPAMGKFDPHLDQTLPEYAASWFAVVTETEMWDHPSRITEKAMKPLVNFEPFLVLGHPHALKTVRALGFQTFEDVFDESYDDILDPRDRFERVYAEVRRLVTASDETLSAIERKIEDKLIFNARWGLTRMSSDVRRDTFQRLIDRIMAL